MSNAADKLINFARTNGITKDEWIEAIEMLYATQVDVMLKDSGSEGYKQKTNFGDSIIHIDVYRELLN